MSLSSLVENTNPYDAEEWFYKNLPELNNDTLKLLYSKLNSPEDLAKFLVYLHFKNAPKQASSAIAGTKTNPPEIPKPPPIQTRATLRKYSDDPIENFKKVLDIPKYDLLKRFESEPDPWIALVQSNNYSKLYEALQKLNAPVVYYEGDENVRTPNKDNESVFILLNDTETNRGIYRYLGLLSRLPEDFDFNIVKEKA